MHRPLLLALGLALLAGCSIREPGVLAPRAALTAADVVPPPPSSAFHDTPPRFLSGEAPVYPIGSVLGRRGGTAVIEFVIAEDGSTRDHRVIASDEPSYGVHAVHAVRGWRDEPATKGGRPVPLRVRQTLEFRIR